MSTFSSLSCSSSLSRSRISNCWVSLSTYTSDSTAPQISRARASGKRNSPSSTGAVTSSSVPQAARPTSATKNNPRLSTFIAFIYPINLRHLQQCCKLFVCTFAKASGGIGTRAEYFHEKSDEAYHIYCVAGAARRDGAGAKRHQREGFRHRVPPPGGCHRQPFPGLRACRYRRGGLFPL